MQKKTRQSGGLLSFGFVNMDAFARAFSNLHRTSILQRFSDLGLAAKAGVSV